MLGPVVFPRQRIVTCYVVTTFRHKVTDTKQCSCKQISKH